MNINTEPKFLEVKDTGDKYVAVPVDVVNPSNDVVRRIGYDSTSHYHVEKCLTQANLIDDLSDRKDFVLSELEHMFG